MNRHASTRRWPAFSHPPAGRAIPLAALWRAMRLDAERAWPDCVVRYFDSGTSALAQAVRSAGRELNADSPSRVLLPAYGCPNLLAAVLATGARPEFLDIDPQILAPANDLLRAELLRRDCIAICVDMFGVPSANGTLAMQDPMLRERLISDLAQSYAPYLPGWRPLARHTVVSFGRAKPLSLTGGGALLAAGAPPDAAEAASMAAIGVSSWLRISLRAALYNRCLGPTLYGLLRSLPMLGVGSTRFVPLEQIRELDGSTRRVLIEVWRELTRQLAKIEQSTRLMLHTAESAGLAVHPLARNATPRMLWRIPVLHGSEQEADRFAAAAAQFGVSRLYGATLPEFAGLSPAQAQERWPNAWAFARRLTTLPTHGRLVAGELAELTRLARISRR